MSNPQDYVDAFESFNSMLEEGQEVQHSAQDRITVDCAQSFYNADETDAEESFSTHLDSEGLELIFSLEECLDNRNNLKSFVRSYLFNRIEESFINGNKKQAYNQLTDLDCIEIDDFIDECENISLIKYLLESTI